MYVHRLGRTVSRDRRSHIYLCIYTHRHAYTYAHIRTHTHTYTQTHTHAHARIQVLTNTPNWLQHTATHCNALQHTATRCITLHHTATYYTGHDQHAWLFPRSMGCLCRWLEAFHVEITWHILCLTYIWRFTDIQGSFTDIQSSFAGELMHFMCRWHDTFYAWHVLCLALLRIYMLLLPDMYVLTYMGLYLALLTWNILCLTFNVFGSFTDIQGSLTDI